MRYLRASEHFRATDLSVSLGTPQPALTSEAVRCPRIINEDPLYLRSPFTQFSKFDSGTPIHSVLGLVF